MSALLMACVAAALLIWPVLVVGVLLLWGVARPGGSAMSSPARRIEAVDGK